MVGKNMLFYGMPIKIGFYERLTWHLESNGSPLKNRERPLNKGGGNVREIGEIDFMDDAGGL